MAPQTISRSRRVRCTGCGRLPKRSTEQNKRYWKLLGKVEQEYLPDGEQFSSKAWHLQCRKQWLGCTDYKMPDGTVVTIPNSTANLETDSFSDYMTQVEAWANARGVFLDE